jgi:hypothetical protein
MADRCPRCFRPIQTDRDWMEGTMPAGACRQTGGVECESIRDYRVRDVINRARMVIHDWRHQHPVGAAVLELEAALRALDGEG